MRGSQRKSSHLLRVFRCKLAYLHPLPLSKRCRSGSRFRDLKKPRGRVESTLSWSPRRPGPGRVAASSTERYLFQLLASLLAVIEREQVNIAPILAQAASTFLFGEPPYPSLVKKSISSAPPLRCLVERDSVRFTLTVSVDREIAVKPSYSTC